MIPKSAVSAIRWPALVNSDAASLLAMQYQLLESERLPFDELERRQLAELLTLLRHAADTVPYYRAVPAYVALAERDELRAPDWRQLPVLTRPALQDAGDAMRSDRVPEDHLPLSETITTGSTGRPIRAAGTRITGALWLAITLRDLLWHGWDLTAKLVALRADPAGSLPAEGVNLPLWHGAFGGLVESGPCAVLSISHDIKTQAAWLVDQDPDYILSYPSNLLAIADHLRTTGAKLGKLRGMSTYGEGLSPARRAALRDSWGVPVTDMYSAQELGYIALQCPQTEQYHVQSEVARVEILDGAGEPCAPGETGRVVISPLHNYATPLLRYEIGDYAEVGEPCQCGRTLPVLNRVMGRQRNIWTLPSGEQFWPMFTSQKWGHMDAIRQLQLVQHAVDRIEAKIVGPRRLSVDEEREFTDLLREQFTFPFELTLTYLHHIDRSIGMKFEDFVSHVRPGGAT